MYYFSSPYVKVKNVTAIDTQNAQVAQPPCRGEMVKNFLSSAVAHKTSDSDSDSRSV